jgi:hypothetical protein
MGEGDGEGRARDEGGRERAERERERERESIKGRSREIYQSGDQIARSSEMVMAMITTAMR